MPDPVAEHVLGDNLPVRVVEHPITIRAVGAPPGSGSHDQEPVPGHGLHGDVSQRQRRDRRDRSQVRGVDRDARVCRPGRARIRERSPASRDSPRGHSLQAFRRRPHRDHLASWPDRRADPDVTIQAVDDAMTTDPQDRKAHHLTTPHPVPAPRFVLPVTHRRIQPFQSSIMCSWPHGHRPIVQSQEPSSNRTLVHQSARQ